MNLAHIHLILNHIPVVGLPLALIFLIQGVRKKDGGLQNFALGVLSLIALMAVPVYFTGEPAEEVVEHLPGVLESFIESHEEAALFSLILTLLCGVIALLGLWKRHVKKKYVLAVKSVILVGAIAVASLGYTAYLGGNIRHTEFRSGDHGKD